MEPLPYVLLCDANLTHIQMRAFPSMEEFYMDRRSFIFSFFSIRIQPLKSGWASAKLV